MTFLLGTWAKRPDKRKCRIPAQQADMQHEIGRNTQFNISGYRKHTGEISDRPSARTGFVCGSGCSFLVFSCTQHKKHLYASKVNVPKFGEHIERV